MKFFKKSFCIIISFILSLSLISCGTVIKAKNLTKKYSALSLASKKYDESFIDSVKNFSFELIKNTEVEDNFVISPLSALLCLALISNGADNNTKSEFEKSFNISIDKINEYICDFIKNKGKSIGIANSVWVNSFRDFNVEELFLKKARGYFNAEVYKCDFDNNALNDINNWCKNNTKKLIDKIIDEIDGEALSYFINSIYFESEWNNKYEKSNITEFSFNNADGTIKTIPCLKSTENYFEKDNTVGFKKLYKDTKYSYLVILPPENTDIIEYVKNLDNSHYDLLLKSSNETRNSAMVSMPEFKIESKFDLEASLMEMGIKDAFSQDNADFSLFTKDTKAYLDFVLQKAYIEVDRSGTKAAAVTIGGMKDTAEEPPTKIIKVDRPFIYGIVETENNMPLFLGVVNNI